MALLVVITAALYVPVVDQEFSQWDDVKYVSVVWKPSWERAWKIATDYELQFIRELYFNPIHFLSLMADQALIGAADRPQAWISKVANVGYHALNSILVFILLTAMGTSRTPAFLGALVFAVHPAQVGTVAWIAERKNLLATFFCLSSLIVFIKYLQNGLLRFLLLTMACFLGGLLSKPSAVVLPAILIVTAFTADADKSLRNRGLVFAGAMLVVALGWGLNVMRTERTFSWILPSWPYRPLLASGTTWFYISKFVVPTNLSPIYPKWDVPAHVGWFGLLAFLLVVASLVVCYFRKNIDRWTLWGLVFFCVSVAPVSGLVAFGYMSHSYVGDHLVYLPLVGLVVVASRVIQLVLERLSATGGYGRLFLAGLCVWIGLLAFASVKQELLWRTPTTMWEAILERNPSSAAAYNNYGYVTMRKGDLGKAEELFKKACEFGPGLDKPYYNLGLIYQSRGEFEQAKKMFAEAFHRNPDDVHPLLMNGKVLHAEGKHEEAVRFLEKYVKRIPASAELRTGLGLSYFKTGAEEKALEEFGKAIEVNPFVAEPYVHKAALMLSRNVPDEAIRLADRALKLSNRADANNVLGAAYAHKGDPSKALRHFLAAYKLQPDFPDLRDNVANAMMDLGDYAAAEEWCRKSEEAGKPCAIDTKRRIHDRN
jgi:tetratricopeptide (TPR) repeat protein